MTNEAQASEALQVVEIQIENVLGIRQASFLPNSGASVLYGDNGEGKTSLLSALRAGFKGLPADLVTIGEDTARVMLRLKGPRSEFVVDRKRTATGQKLEVRDGQGVRVERPSKWLNGIIGDFSLDPGLFAMAKGDDQVRMFTDAFPVELIGSDVEEIAGRYRVKVEGRNGFVVLREVEERIEEERRAIGVSKRQAIAVAEDAKPADVTVADPAEAIAQQKAVVEAAVAALGSVSAENQARGARNAQRDSLRDQIMAADAQAEKIDAETDREQARLQAEIERLEARKAQVAEEAEASKSAILERVERDQARLNEIGINDEPGLTDEGARAELETARAGLAALESKAENYRRIKVWEQKVNEAETLEEEWSELDTLLNEIVRKKWVRNLWRQVPISIPGLELGRDSKDNPCLVIAEPGENEGDLVRVPLSQVNTAKRLQVGVRIAAALNADYPVKILAADDAEHLTRVNRDELAKAAEEAGFQVLLLVASDPEDVPEGGLLMRDGIVHHADRPSSEA